MDEPIPWCATCGTPMTGDPGQDPDEDPAGDAGRPGCGNCAREREFFVLDISDGVEDGRMDLGGEED